MFETAYDANENAEEGEAQLYFDLPRGTVVKRHDAFMHATWGEFFDRIALHNYLFPEAPYTLVSLTFRNGKLAAIVEQPVLRFARGAVRDEVEEAMHNMGFARVGGDDYASPARGLRVEDLHDENVVVDADGVMLFIDPIIYAV